MVDFGVWVDDDALSFGVFGLEGGEVCETDEVGAVVDPEFDADAFSVAVDGGGGAGELFGDLFGAEALADEGEDFEFSVGEDVQGAEIDVTGFVEVLGIGLGADAIERGGADLFEDPDDEGDGCGLDDGLDGGEARAEAVAFDDLGDDGGAPGIECALDEAGAFVGPGCGGDVFETSPEDGFIAVGREDALGDVVGVGDVEIRGEEEDGDGGEAFAQGVEDGS